jgi:phosphohistidine swiveling domain-containing protein
VMGTGDATRRLHDGQRVRVDGGRGVVLPAANPAEGSRVAAR